jgi:hypothetical protein
VPASAAAAAALVPNAGIESENTGLRAAIGDIDVRTPAGDVAAAAADAVETAAGAAAPAPEGVKGCGDAKRLLVADDAVEEARGDAKNVSDGRARARTSARGPEPVPAASLPSLSIPLSLSAADAAAAVAAARTERARTSAGAGACAIAGAGANAGARGGTAAAAAGLATAVGAAGRRERRDVRWRRGESIDTAEADVAGIDEDVTAAAGRYD